MESAKPSDISRAYAYACPPMNTAPMKKVSQYHSRIPQRAGLNGEPVRPTKPFSARNTPIWHVMELSTRIKVVTIENHGHCWPPTTGSVRKCEAPHSHIDCSPGAAIAWVASRSEKYAANRAAKNISSFASQMSVPMATMSGRPWMPWRRAAGTGWTAPWGRSTVALPLGMFAAGVIIAVRRRRGHVRGAIDSPMGDGS